MIVYQVNHSDKSGGAARAAYRVNKALNQNGLLSKMAVNIKTENNSSTLEYGSTTERLTKRLRGHFPKLTNLVHKSQNDILHSVSCIPSSWPQNIAKSEADIINLHWVNSEMMSIKDISLIQKPLVWTLHDMWSFCGAEHYSFDSRYIAGYNKNNRPSHESGYDINRWTWNRKRRHWKKPFQIITVSNWLKEQAEASQLFHNWPITCINNPIDTDKWVPIDKNIAKSLLKITPNLPTICFGALGTDQPHKGYDLLCKALDCLATRYDFKFQLLIFGKSQPEKQENTPYPTHYLGTLHDDISLNLVYSAADITVVPSRLEAFGQTASESFTCGTPVACFDTSGLKDIVDHQVNGYVAKAFDSLDLAKGIKEILNSPRYDSICKRAREKAVSSFSYKTIAVEYERVYLETIDTYKTNLK